MILRKLYHAGIAQATYLIGCPGVGEAVVIDPNRNSDEVIQLAEREGLRITTILETHIHADFVSGARGLAERTGAAIHASAMGGPDWQYAYDIHPLRDGTEIRVGAIRIVAHFTPGHTPEHMAFVLFDGDQEKPIGAFTGDFIFVGDVGRPDLLEKAAGVANTMTDGAGALFDSLQRFKALPSDLLIWPGHGAGSPCGKALGGIPESTLGYEMATNPAFGFTDKQAFVDWVLDGQPEPPMYFAEMKRINKVGPSSISSFSRPRLGVSQLDATLLSSTYVIDLRPRRWEAAESIHRAVSVPFGNSFAAWAGSLFKPSDAFVLLAPDAEQARAATADLALVGLDDVVGWIQVDAAISEADRLGILGPQAKGPLTGTLIDVRTLSEREEEHKAGSIHAPMNRLPEVLSRLDREEHYVVHCYSGARAHVAGSFLRRQGFQVTSFAEDYGSLPNVPALSAAG